MSAIQVPLLLLLLLRCTYYDIKLLYMLGLSPSLFLVAAVTSCDQLFQVSCSSAVTRTGDEVEF